MASCLLLLTFALASSRCMVTVFPSCLFTNMFHVDVILNSYTAVVPNNSRDSVDTRQSYDMKSYAKIRRCRLFIVSRDLDNAYGLRDTPLESTLMSLHFVQTGLYTLHNHTPSTAGKVMQCYVNNLLCPHLHVRKPELPNLTL